MVLGLAIAWVLLVPAADWLARHDVGSVKGPLLQTARDAARGRLLTLGAGLFAAGALLFTARNFILSREGQVTDRYTKAVEQLGSDKLDVRIGGIYALERIARDSARDHPTVMEVLAAFIREHSREQWQLPDDPYADPPKRRTRPDVQAAVTVIGRRNPRHDRLRVNLDLADLTDADLTGADLTDARLSGANLTDANLAVADLTNADLRRADLTRAILVGARLRAVLAGADLTGADLTGANLTRAYLGRADLTGANLFQANLAGANLTDAKLTDAKLTLANLTGAFLQPDAAVPDGWQRDTDSGRLKRADAGSGGAAEN